LAARCVDQLGLASVLAAFEVAGSEDLQIAVGDQQAQHALEGGAVHLGEIHDLHLGQERPVGVDGTKDIRLCLIAVETSHGTHSLNSAVK